MVLKRLIFIFLSGALFLLLGSCTVLEPGLSVLRGNYFYQQGRYQDALLFYLKGEDTGKYSGRITYNVGNVYYALGEGQAALQIWAEIDGNRDSEVSFNTIFNTGVIYYQLGNYPEAYRAFRTALELDTSNLDAKKNLELTIDRLEVEARSGESRTENPAPETTEDARRILQYIKRKEGSLWKSKESGSDAENDW